MHKILTVIIPTYNMQDCLHRCLDSLVLKDEELMNSLQVLVINDGSTDQSSAIAHEYEARYPFTFRVIDKENGNYGSCVNRGLKEATGKYVKLLDADDWFDTTEFESYLSALKEIEADLILTDFSIVNAQSMRASLAYHPNLQEGHTYSFSDCTLKSVGVYMMHAVTYRVSLLHSINYVQTTGISYTDTEWTYNPLYAVQTMVYFNFNLYQYLLGREGQTMDPKVMLRTINHHEIIARSLIENEEKHPSEGFAHLTIKRQILYLLVSVYRTRLVLQDEASFCHDEMAAFDSYVKEHCPDMYRRIGRLHVKTGLPIPYVRYWRVFARRFPVDSIRNLYRRIRYGKACN